MHPLFIHLFFIIGGGGQIRLKKSPMKRASNLANFSTFHLILYNLNHKALKIKHDIHGTEGELLTTKPWGSCASTFEETL